MSKSVKYKIVGEGKDARIDLSDHLPVGTNVILIYNLKDQSGERGGYPIIGTALPHQLSVYKLHETIGDLEDVGFIAINTEEDRITLNDLAIKRERLMNKLADHEEQSAIIKDELKKY